MLLQQCPGKKKKKKHCSRKQWFPDSQQLAKQSYFGPSPSWADTLAVLWSLCPSERQNIFRLMQLDPR